MNSSSPKISVIIPIYNVDNYLKQCLESLINQTLKDIEIICINDGSTDNSLNILNEFAQKDKRIIVVDKQNSGYGHSMNIGLDKAKGEYIGIVEPDDFVKNTMFEDLYNIAIKYNSELVKSEHYEYYTSDKSAQSRKTGSLANYPIMQPFSIKQYPGLVKIQPAIWSCIYKKELLEKNNIRFMETPGASFQDTSFCFKTMCLANNIVLTLNAYYYYRQDNINSSVKSKNKVYSICDEYKEIDNFLGSNADVKDFINSQKLIKQYKVYIWNLVRLDDKFVDEFLAEFVKTFKAYYENGEITKQFYKKVNKKEFRALIEDENKYRDIMLKKINKLRCRKKRKKLFSVHMNSSRASIILFGKHILEVG